MPNFLFKRLLLLAEFNFRAEEGEPEGLGLCPRCSECVYLAESRLGPNGTRFHVGCYTCKVCNK